MEWAYDNTKREYVNASDVQRAKHSRYRYICPCCGEEVLFVAEGVNRAYFKHYGGNAGHDDCKYYIPGSGDGNPPLPKLEDTVNSFYYESAGKKIYLTIKLTDEEISKYERIGAEYEVRSFDDAEPFCSVSIRRKFITPDEAYKFVISKASETYYCAASSDKNRRKSCKVFREGETAIFRRLAGNTKKFLAKIVVGEKLFTDNYYFILTKDREFIRKLYNSTKSSIVLTQQEEIKVGNEKFIGFLCQIKEVTSRLISAFRDYGYELEEAGTFDLLWPPLISTEDGYISKPQNIFVFSSFELVPHGNTNLDSDDIHRVTENVTRLSINKDTKIFYNIENIIQCGNTEPQKIEEIFVEESEVEKFTVPGDAEYYLHSPEGIRRLSEGDKIFLHPGDFIQGYQQTYVMSACWAPEKPVVSKKELLEDVLKNYKVEIPYDKSQFGGILANIKRASVRVVKYLGDCEKTGTINLAVARMIQEGKL